MKTKKKKTESLGHFDYESVVMGMEAGNSDDYAALLARDVRLKRLLGTVRVRKGNILDIGCGGGTITNFLAASYPRTRVYGCDVSKQAISLARKYGKPRTSFGVIQNGKFPYKSNFFDLCVCFDVLEHVPDVPTFMAETRRVLKKGGVIFFAVPCEGQFLSLTWWLQKLRIGHKLTYKHVGHIHPEFTHEYVENLFKKNKFKLFGPTYSEHFATQCVRFVRFILPKEALEYFLGSQTAAKCYDRAIVTAKKGKADKGILTYVRRAWLALGVVFDFIENTDAALFKRWGFAAWKIFIHATKVT